MFPSPCSGHWDLLPLTLTLLTTEHDSIETKVIFAVSGYFCCSCSGLFLKLPAMVLPLIFQLSLKLFPHKASTKLSSCKFFQLWFYVPSHLQRWEGISFAFSRTLALLYFPLEPRKRKRCWLCLLTSHVPDVLLDTHINVMWFHTLLSETAFLCTMLFLSCGQIRNSRTYFHSWPTELKSVKGQRKNSCRNPSFTSLCCNKAENLQKQEESGVHMDL